ncbi:hypothetical protein [Streptomyces sp. MH13]|uniref:hypothetical protein n=1 Tax=unclassified Streptomyces TaxID=2593676 RepID=UPI003CE9411B
MADEAADEARASALAAGKSAQEAEAAAAGAWSRVVELREAEEARARQQAEERRKAERENEPEPESTCYLYPTRDSLPPCAYGAASRGKPVALPEAELGRLSSMTVRGPRTKGCGGPPRSRRRCTAAAPGAPRAGSTAGRVPRPRQRYRPSSPGPGN